ncbi:MAG: D-serine ammonia-lyase, partial [Lactiplantibacillus plantarum]|nr:D-serine ammonia-lyase [Lactiplantibacillus plantarum]
GLTAADGLAVSRPSRLAGKVMRTLLLGTATFEDDDLSRYLTKLVDTEDVMVEPSAAAGFTAIAPIMAQFPTLAGKDVTHIVWATGGDMMPESERQLDYELGQKLLTKINNR